MKLSDMKPCPVCGGTVAPFIYEVTVKRHLVIPAKANQMLGLTQMLGGSVALAEVMGPHSNITEQMDEHTVFVCQDCGIETFGMVVEAISHEEEDDGDEAGN